MSVLGGTEPDDRRGIPSEIRDVSFQVSRRGYDRDSVDGYVTRVNELIAELEATRSPEAAVREALRQVGEKTTTILDRAGETAEEITLSARQNAEAETARAEKEAEDLVTNARQEADEILSRSRREAEETRAEASSEAADRIRRAEKKVAELKEEAEARLRELEADTEAVRGERGRLLHDIRELAAGVEQAAHEADKRFPPPDDATATAEQPAQEKESAVEGNGANARKARSSRR